MNTSKNRSRILLGLLALALVLLLGQGALGPKTPSGALSSPALVSAQAETNEKDFKLLKVGTGGQNVREMQSVLKDLGYYEGNIDGNFSRVFEAAVKAFQKDFGLEENGRIDYALYALLMEDFSGFSPQTQTPSAKKTVRPSPSPSPAPDVTPLFVDRDGQYSDKEHVAAYLKAFGKLPSNYITKQEAQKLGWVSSYGNLWEVAPGKSIGGDRYGNYEGTLPQKSGRKYFECDIDFDGRYRNAQRIIYSNDGLVFYTKDHYETFEEIE